MNLYVDREHDAIQPILADHPRLAAVLRPEPADAVRFAAAFAGSLLAVAVAMSTGLPHWAGLALILLVVAGCSVRAGLGVAVGAGVLGWLFLTGFEVNHMGVLRITSLADADRLTTVVGVALVVALVTRRPPAAAATL